MCEPQMSKRGLYSTISFNNRKNITKLYMDFLQYSDGKNDLNDISKLIMYDIKKTKKIYELLKKHKIIK